MFERLHAAQSLTPNQGRNGAPAVPGDMLGFFRYFLIGFVLAFIIGPWQLTFGQSAIILLSSGIGAILGAAVWGGSPTASAGARYSSGQCSISRWPPAFSR